MKKDSSIQTGRMPNSETSLKKFLQGSSKTASGKIALLGSCGAGMTALGEILLDQGHYVVGFDKSISTPAVSETSPKSKLVSTNHWKWNPTQSADADVCVCSPAIRQDDHLRQQFLQAGIPVISLHQALDAVFANCHQICIAGTHGKSTTTAMLAWIMEQTQLDPSYFIGAKFQHNGRSGRSQQQFAVHASGVHPNRPAAIIESCEFNRSFHQLSPSTIVLTGMERDHFDCFTDQHEEDAAYLQLLRKLPSHGCVIYNSSCRRSTGLVRQINNPTLACEIQSIGRVSNKADFRISHFEQQASGIQFRIQFRAESSIAKVPVFGRHNAINASNAIAAAVSQGLSVTDAVHALTSFPGIERRFQSRGCLRGMELIDDYAHHPTAVRTTLQATRKKFPKREIRVCFEPHQLIRLAELQDDFVDALSLADTVYVLPVLAARESASTAKCHEDSHKLIIRLRSRGTSAFFSPNLDHVVQTVDHSANPNAVLLTMGAGSTHLIHDKLTNRLRRYSVA